MGFQCNSCGCNDNNEIDTMKEVTTGKDAEHSGYTDPGHRGQSQMEKQGMTSTQHNNSRSRMQTTVSIRNS